MDIDKIVTELLTTSQSRDAGTAKFVLALIVGFFILAGLLHIIASVGKARA